MPGLLSRLQQVVGGHWATTSAPTTTYRQQYDLVYSKMESFLGSLRVIVEQELPNWRSSSKAPVLLGHGRVVYLLGLQSNREYARSHHEVKGLIALSHRGASGAILPEHVLAKADPVRGSPW